MAKLALLLAILSAALTLDAHAQAAPAAAALQLSPPRSLPVAPESARWNAEREDWYGRNRAIALSGKVAAVVGVAGAITGAVLDNLGGLVSGYVLEYAGLLLWSGADLKATNRFRSWGFRLRKAAAVVSVIGVFTSSPFTIVAGSLQSARIREVHREAVSGTSSLSASGFGAGLRVRF